MRSALVVGATGFVGGHVVANLRDHDYEVVGLSRGSPAVGLGDRPGVEHVTVDRTDESELRSVADRVDPDVVIDCAAYFPDDVRTATDVFADADAYVYVSSGATYAVQEIPKREDATPLRECTPEQAADDSMASYGPRKAECDRIATGAAERGVAATSVRSTVVYGPGIEWLERDASTGSVDPPTWGYADLAANQRLHDYWVDRIRRFDRVLVPGDGTAIWHRAYVEDVADALRVVAERGEPGEAYNVGDRRVCTLEDVVDLIADALETTVEVVHASRRELAPEDLDPTDFVLYHHPMTGYPHVLDTGKLARLGWESTPVEVTTGRTVAESVDGGRDLLPSAPSRESEERLIDSLTG